MTKFIWWRSKRSNLRAVTLCVYAATSSLIPLTQKLHPSQLRSATQRFLCPVVICISNTHIHLYLCTQCLHERLLIVVFTLDLCPNENTDDSRGWGNYENLFILYISHSHMNSAVTIAGLSRVGNIALAFHDQLGGSLSKLTHLHAMGSMGSSLPSLNLFGCPVYSVWYSNIVLTQNCLTLLERSSAGPESVAIMFLSSI